MRISAVIPVLNAEPFLPRVVAALLAARRRTPGVELVFVDNGSSDGSLAILCALQRDVPGIKIVRREGVTIAAVRNYGARVSSGAYLSFIDADCLVAEDYFENAREVVRAMGVAATGCRVCIPHPPHWIEEAWHCLHYVARDRDVRYLNSGNFFVSRDAFLEVGGFDETLVTGEDAELGMRLCLSGYRIYESQRVGAVHLGNPRSVRQFYRRSVWHALGMFGTVRGVGLDRPTAMMLAHLGATLAMLVVLFVPTAPLAWRLLAALALQLAVPAATVVFRSLQTRRFGPIVAGVALYWLYYWARLQALALIFIGRTLRYRK